MATRRTSLKELQAQEERSRRTLAKKRAALVKVHSQLREAETKAHTKLRTIVGDMVLETRLAEVSLLTLQEALHALARCVHHEAGYAAFLATYGDAAAQKTLERDWQEMAAWGTPSARESGKGALGVSLHDSSETGKAGA